MSNPEYGIHTCAMQVELNIRNWTAEKIDKQASKEVDESKGTKVPVNKVHKQLLSGTTLLHDMIKYSAKVRSWNIDNTLPWSDRGPRLLPVAQFMDHKAEVRKRENVWRGMLEELKANYLDLQVEAAYNSGASYNPEDYPSVEALESKFSFACAYSPVPTKGDFRIDVGQKAVEELQSQFESHVEDKVALAMDTAWDRLHKHLNRMSDRLTDKDANGNTQTFRDTLLTDAKGLVESLKHFNIKNDPTLEEARRALSATLSNIDDAQDLRDFRDTRLQVKDGVDKILSKFDF